ncbi:hypothetical protein KEG38_32080 [Polyangium jinanense]|uniref:hypothetical protein n=1 Tax=Polyangium jinanense TaxID=2829994 RepID=UPI002341E59A|nr:hypothetical protein [Polyangium jinanense]MDC3958538.1 hypothetical protein [Polyangium jinanense]
MIGDVPSWEAKDLTIAGSVWREADRELALAWLSLRRILAGESIRLRDGSVLALLGDGIFAELSIHSHSPRVERTKLRASLLMPIHYEWSKVKRAGWDWRWVLHSFLKPVISHLAETESQYNASTHIGPSLPRAIRLEGHGLVADITFRYSPLFTSSGHRTAPSIATAAAAASITNAAATDDDDRRRD